uniref:Uncharacterized protein n=1 Tax=Rhizophora mucronata TaxID=61149 RepID=A0A2P2QJ35_RHIMU
MLEEALSLDANNLPFHSDLRLRITSSQTQRLNQQNVFDLSLSSLGFID